MRGTGALLQQGGWVLGAILAVSLLGWVLIFLKAMQLRRARPRGVAAPDQIVALVRRGAWASAQAQCAAREDLVGRLLAEALRAPRADRRFFEKHLRPALHGERGALEQNLGVIAGCAAVAPLLGLLGTVLGMVEVFTALGTVESARLDALAGGISRALVTTQAGLVTAVPLVLLHAYLQARAERTATEGELAVKKIEAALCAEPAAPEAREPTPSEEAG